MAIINRLARRRTPQGYELTTRVSKSVALFEMLPSFNAYAIEGQTDFSKRPVLM